MSDQKDEPMPMVAQIRIAIYPAGFPSRVRIFKSTGVPWADFYISSETAADILGILHSVRVEQTS